MATRPSSRTIWPTVTDPRSHMEEQWTLSRTASNRLAQATAAKTDGQATHITTPEKKDADDSSSRPHTPLRRRFVFADPVAFRYLEDDPATEVLERRGRLKGYELYMVEQWACSRVHPTFVITTFSGDENRSVLVGVLGIPADEEVWSPRLRVYFKAISQYHARPKDTPLGTLMVTNLSSFPSALTVIPVPDGDVRKHREDFVVNENLKRLGCSGRSGLSLSNPAGATQAKFHQLYRTSERIPLYGAVIEMVKLCQVALIVFGKLEQEYADGLLCDVTEKAVGDWWTEIGSEFYNTEPSDSTLGPATVAALLGMLMGARNRLNYYGAPVAKDAFDIIALKRGIAYFQKSQKLERTRRLDRQTLNKLHSVTAKAAAGEGWAVPKAVKSTVAELGGKGGEMMMEIVGGGNNKAAIGDIETLDLEHFTTLVHGERGKWLWHGKSRRNGTADALGKSLPEMGNLVFSNDDHGGYLWSNKKQDSVPVQERESEAVKRENGIYSEKPAPSSALSIPESPGIDKDPQLRKAVLKNMTGKISDARSGFGRIKDAVGRRGHSSKNSKDELIDNDMGSYHQNGQDPNSAFSAVPVGRAFSWKNKPEEYINGHPKVRDTPPLFSSSTGHPESPQGELKTTEREHARLGTATKDRQEAEASWAAQVRSIQDDLVSKNPSVAGSVCGGEDLEGPFLEAQRDPESFEALLHRRTSISGRSATPDYSRNDAWWPRHMSFSDVEEAVLTWTDIGVLVDSQMPGKSSNWDNYQKQKFLDDDYKSLYACLRAFQSGEMKWAQRRVADIEGLDLEAGQDEEEFSRLYYQLSDAYQTVRGNSRDILEEEKAHVMEAIKDVEVLGAKLEYEINALVSKVEDVEDGVSTFESHVDGLEERAVELEKMLLREGWVHWIVRTLTGMGSVAQQ